MSNPASSESSCESLSSNSEDPARVQLLIDEDNLSSSGCPLSQESLMHCCQRVLEQQTLLDLEAVATIELSAQFVGQTEMQALNKQYRGKDSPTNVLSFESGMPVFPSIDSSGTGGMLAVGDLVFCPQVVVKEADEQGKSVHDHWIHLFVHGTLHLCGYDHENTEDSQAMESLEIQILSDMGIPDPYDIIEKQ